MMKIFVTLPVEERHKEYLQKQAEGCKTKAEFHWMPAKAVTAEIAADADVVIGNISTDVLREVNRISAAANGGKPALKWVQLQSAGAEAYTGEDIVPEDAILTNSAGAYGTSVSEHMIAMTFALIRRFDQYAKQQAAHIWKTAGKVTSVEDATVLVLGLGDIGGKYAEKMHALGAHVIGVRRTQHSGKPAYLEEQHTIEELDDLLPRADIVAMVLPGGEDTCHIMDERRLRLMKPGAYLINDGRGNAIDPEALKKVLKEGRLGGVGLDVTEPEPLPAEDALWEMDRVIITPHIAGQFLLPKTFENVVHIAGENLHAFLNGEKLTHVVNRKTGY